jgi:hypothetical protein
MTFGVSRARRTIAVEGGMRWLSHGASSITFSTRTSTYQPTAKSYS